MRITIIGSRAFDSLEYHLTDSFRQLGHEALTIDIVDVLPIAYRLTYWAARFSESFDRWLAHRLVVCIIARQPDLVIVVYRHLHPVLVTRLKKALPHTPIVQVNPDALTNLDKQQIMAADFDVYFSKEPHIVQFLRAGAGRNAHYLPEAFNPRVHYPPDMTKAEAEQVTNVDVLLYGGLYAYRNRIVEQVMRAGIRLTVFGKPGPYCPPTARAVLTPRLLVGEEKNKLVFGAKIVLNAMHYAEVSGVNQKFFEINGIGGFQLCDSKPTLAAYSGISPHTFAYQSTAEAIERIQHYLHYPAERHELAHQQRDHFWQHHTFDLRVQQMLTIIGL